MAKINKLLSMVPIKDPKACCFFRLLVVFLFLILAQGLSHTSYGAKEPHKVQILTGDIDPAEFIVYKLPNLKRGEKLFIYLEGTSGNLDPILGLVKKDFDINVFEKEYQTEIENVITRRVDPLNAVDEIRNKYFLSWDDDSGEGYDAAMKYEIQSDGDYQLIVGGSLSSAISRHTFGSFKLIAGINAPEVLTGMSKPTEDEIVLLERGDRKDGISVQEFTGSLGEDKDSTFVVLNEFDAGDTLYVFIESTSGDLVPTVELSDFGGKPVRVANFLGKDKKATMEYRFHENTSEYRLNISAFTKGDKITKGDYRMLIGVNAPRVLTGNATSKGLEIIRKPIEVKAGLKLQQIINVNQQQEFFGIVAAIRMDWTDPAQAFSPDTCKCLFKTYTDTGISKFISEVEGRWPDFTIYNLQGFRRSQNRVVVVRPDGHATYFERVSTDIQVDFDFSKFPLDKQKFLIQIDMIYPEEYYVFSELEGFSEISKQHGEDEFNLTSFETSISSEQVGTESTNSRFTFSFEAPRNLDYYTFRIFIPILLILIVSWVTFYLHDYVKRAEIASANLLVFIAFSFSLAENYPRLGYLTFLDIVMAMTFIVSALVVIYNVFLKWLEIKDKAAAAQRIDDYMDWFFPASFVVSAIVLYLMFF